MRADIKYKWLLKQNVYRILGIFFILGVFFVGCLSQSIYAKEIVASGSCGENVIWELDDEGTLAIHGTGNMANYSIRSSLYGMEPSSPWFVYEDSLKRLVIEDGVTSIGDYAFYNCRGFTGNLIIPNSVTNIGQGAFHCCMFTGDLIIPDNITSIGKEAFSGCKNFDGCLTISNGVTSIERFTFGHCSGLTGNLLIPQNIEKICSNAFENCSGLTGDLIIPNGVMYLESEAFENCTGFTSLIIPKSLSKTYDFPSVFRGNRFTSIICDEQNPSYTSSFNGTEYNGIFSKDGKSLYFGNKNTAYPQELKKIESNAFWGSLEKPEGELNLPEGLQSIGGSAFSGCSGLTGDLIIPDSVTEIYSNAFMSCNGFTGNLVLSDNLKRIGIQAFSGCSGLTGNLIIPEGVTDIGEYAFSGCSGLNGMLSIPSSTTTIGAGAFLSCKNLTGNLLLPEGVEYIGHGAFAGCKGFIGTLTIPNSLTELESSSGMYGINSRSNEWYQFYYCSGIKRVDNRSNFTIYLTPLYSSGSWMDEDTGENINQICNGVAVKKDYDITEDLKDAHPVTLYFGSGKENVSFNFTWSPGRLLKSKETVDNDLSQICLILSNKVYNEKGRENIDEALLALNLVDDDKDELSARTNKSDNRWHMNYTNDISPAYSLALKTYSFNGENYNIITVVVRGTNDFMGKDMGKDLEIDGFISAAQSVYEGLNSFLDGHGIKLSDKNNRFLITGHSLGGAVANLLQNFIIKNNLYSDEEETPLNNGMTCYTYESPYTLWASDRVFSQSGRSINFIKEGDFFSQWSNNYSMYLSNTITYAYSNSAIGTISRGLLLYKPKYYSSMRFGTDIYMNGITERAMRLYKEYTGEDYNSLDMVNGYHQCEIIMAMIKDRIERNVLNKANSKIKQNYRVISTYCPVDIVVIDSSSHDVVVSIKDNEVTTLINNDIMANTIGDKKFLRIPSDVDYSIKLTGTDEGTMDFVIQDVCQDDNGIYLSNTSRFDNVALTKGKVMKCPIESTVSTADIKLFVLDENGKAVKTVSEDGTEADYEAENKKDDTDSKDPKDESGDKASSDVDTGLKPIETQYKTTVNVKDILLPYYTKLHPDVVIKKTKFKSSDKKTVKINKKGIAKGGKKSGSAIITMFVKTEETVTKPNGKQKKKLSKWTSACTLDVNNTGKQGK